MMRLFYVYLPTSKWFVRLFRDSGVIKIHKTVLDGGSNFVSHDFWIVSNPVGMHRLTVFFL